MQKLFEGYYDSHLLWYDEVHGLEQLSLLKHPTPIFNKTIPQKLRLGHLTEYFVELELQQNKDIKILAKNIQIQRENVTLGEIDFIIEHQDEIYHVECAYKFYVFDENKGASNIEHWIGPNRKDSLVQKIQKIKKRQFPLINEPEAIAKLDSLGIQADKVKQLILIKGQLFHPFPKQIDLAPLNENALKGFYLDRNLFQGFEKYKIYIPSKHDWLITPHQNVDWLNFNQAIKMIDPQLDNERSVLFWVKFNNGEIAKGFVVWWS